MSIPSAATTLFTKPSISRMGITTWGGEPLAVWDDEKMDSSDSGSAPSCLRPFVKEALKNATTAAASSKVDSSGSKELTTTPETPSVAGAGVKRQRNIRGGSKDDSEEDAVDALTIDKKNTTVRSIIDAATTGNFASLSSNPRFLYTTNAEGDTALTLAAKENNVAAIGFLKRLGMDVNIPNEKMKTPLMIAAASGNEELVALLLTLGSRVDTPNKEGNTALILATSSGHTGVVTQLLKAGARFNLMNNLGNTALMYAARHGHEKIVDLLLNAGASVAMANSCRNTALIFAAASGHVGVVAQLLKTHSLPDFSNKEGNTALIIAAHRGHEKIVDLLLHAGADVHFVNHFKNTALHAAALMGHLAVVKRLLQEKGIQLDIQNSKDQTPLDVAAESEEIASEEVRDAIVELISNAIEASKPSSSAAKATTGSLAAAPRS